MGDIKNINYIVNAYGDMLFRVAYQYTRNRSEAEDVTQDVFVAMLKKMPFKSEEHLKAWLIRVAINKSINYLKSNRKKVLSLDENIDVEAKHSETDEIEELQELPEFDRSVIYLYYYEGYSIKEIAKITGKSANSINIRLFRAREKLKTLLEERR